jgi:hypothetical protein
MQTLKEPLYTNNIQKPNNIQEPNNIQDILMDMNDFEQQFENRKIEIYKKNQIIKKSCFAIHICFAIIFLTCTILFIILGTKTECGFTNDSTIKMTEYNATVINSTIKNSFVHQKHRINIIYDCITSVDIDSGFICNIDTYKGSNLTKCIQNQKLNGSIITVFNEKFESKCYLNNLSRNCAESQKYYNLGWAFFSLAYCFIVFLPCNGLYVFGDS